MRAGRRTRTRSARRSPATSAGAPGTPRSSRRSPSSPAPAGDDRTRPSPLMPAAIEPPVTSPRTLAVGAAVVVLLSSPPILGPWVKLVVALLGLGAILIAWRRPP